MRARVLMLLMLGLVLVLTGCRGKEGIPLSRKLKFEEKPFLGLRLGMEKDAVSEVIETANLPYGFQKDEYREIRRKIAEEAGRTFDDTTVYWTVSFRGDTRLRGFNIVTLTFKSGILKSIDVTAGSREGLIPIEGEKQRANELYDDLLATMKRTYGLPGKGLSIRGNRLSAWTDGDSLIFLGQEFDGENNMFLVKTLIEACDPGEAEEELAALDDYPLYL